MQGEMAIMDRTGDLKIMWDSERPEEVAAARKQFDELTGKGYAAFAVDRKGEKGELIRRFDPEVEKIILAPQLKGGC